MRGSKRSRYFRKPSRREAEDFRLNMKGCNTVEEVIGTVGEPDCVTERTELDAEHHRLYGGPFFKRELMYTRLWKTIHATVCLDQEGRLHFLWSAKPKRKRRWWLTSFVARRRQVSYTL